MLPKKFNSYGRPTLAPKLNSYDAVWATSTFIANPNPQLMSFCHVSGKPDCDVRVIDVASGSGRYACAFARAGYRSVVALESSIVGCDKIRTASSGHPNLTIKHEDILEYDLGNKFDLVVCSGLLEEFGGQDELQRQAVINLQRLTNSGGRIVLKYCLDISTNTPQNRVARNLVRPMFEHLQWNIVHFQTDPEPRYYRNALGDDTYIQTETLVADRAIA